MKIAHTARRQAQGLARLIIVGLTLVGVTGSCSTSRADLELAYGGPLTVLVEAQETRAWLLNPEHKGDAPIEPSPAGYPALAGPAQLDAALGAELGAILSSPSSYLAPGIAKACLPRYGVRFEFRGGAGEPPVDVIVCFECSMLQAYRDGAHSGTLHFDPVQQRFARAALGAFPSNEALQRLAKDP